MNWNHELLTSLIWVGKAFIISLIGMSITAVILGRFTLWGRQFKRIAWPYFSPKRNKLPLLIIALIILLTLFSVRMNVLFSFWYNGFYSAMQKLDATAFWFMLGLFAVLATIHVARALLTFYVRQAFMIHWRVWLTDDLVQRWLEKQAYYRSHFIATDADNPDQRVQQDVDTFVTSSLTLSMGLLDAVVSLFAFTLILWGLSGTLAIFGVEIPRAMVFLVYLYVIIATVFAVYIGRPLIKLNFLNEKFNANFRYALVRLREYGESIAFYKGERVERDTLMTRFSSVISNSWAIVFRSLKFQGFNLGISQAAVVFPFIVQAPRFLDKQITLGDMMQTTQAFGQVQDALSFFRTSYDEFAGYRAVLNRLIGFLETIDAVERLPSAQLQADPADISIKGLTVRTPGNTALIENLELSLPAGASLIIRGPSGAGKTTLLRAIAGLWPYVEGNIKRPILTQALFLPQKPYLPLGSLRHALYYPNLDVPNSDAPTLNLPAVDMFTQTSIDEADAKQARLNLSVTPGLSPTPALNPTSDLNMPTGKDEAAEILRLCQLEHLTMRLDEIAEWSSILSLGEQQRLAIGRALLSQPKILFLDEASSAMDEGLEFAMYQLLHTSLPHAILISVGHRSSLLPFHQQQLELLGGGEWRVSEVNAAS